MKVMTVTEAARNFSQVLDEVEQELVGFLIFAFKIYGWQPKPCSANSCC